MQRYSVDEMWTGTGLGTEASSQVDIPSLVGETQNVAVRSVQKVSEINAVTVCYNIEPASTRIWESFRHPQGTTHLIQ